MEPEVYPSHFALRYKLVQEDESELEGMRKAREWPPPTCETHDKRVVFCGEGMQVYHGTELGVVPGILNQGALLRRQDELHELTGCVATTLPGENKAEILGPIHSKSLEGAFHHAPLVSLDLSDYGVEKDLLPMQVVFGSIVDRYVPCKEFGIAARDIGALLMR